METDLGNRTELTPLAARKYLYPVFEAIANSLQAISEAKEPNGEVIIHIKRDTSDVGLGAISEELSPNQPIIGFAIEDNGRGFTDDNLDSFNKVNSRKKRGIGGKGVGRLLWLKAFKKAEIDSTFQNNGKLNRRKFDFSIAHNGVGKQEAPAVDRKDRRTTVTLVDFLEPYFSACSSNTGILARKIINHFLGHFILGGNTRIVLKDEYEKTEIDLNREFKTKMQLACKETSMSLRGHKFRLEHLSVSAAASENLHQMLFCSQGRVVEQEDLQNHIPSLRTALTGENDRQFFYNVLVHSNAFEGDGTDWERTRLNIPDQKDLATGEDDLTRQELYKKVAEAADKQLKAHLEPLREKNTERIVKYIQNHEPKYRPLAKHRLHWFERIAPNLTDDALSVELYRLNREYEFETKKAMVNVKRSVANPQSAEKHKEKFKHFLTEINDQAIASLADYIVQRRAVLDFLRESIRMLPTGRYIAEKYIHQIICPLRTTTDTVSLEQMNLWIIDERLNFHHYMSSDRPQKSVKPLKGGSDDRADIILFNHALAFADQEFGSIVIVEFKKPMRKDYTEAENPIAQVLRYVDDITSGRVLTRSGRPVPKGTPIYAYIVCDLTPKLLNFSKPYSFSQLPDQKGYFAFFKDYNLYMEMIGFDKLVDDAEKRNAAFFDKLNLPLTLAGH